MEGVFIGIDYGRKRIGIAVSTALGTVHPRRRLQRSTPADDLAVLKNLAEEAEAVAFVVGLPHNMDGSISEMEREVRTFAATLASTASLPVYGADERMTTEAAESVLRAQEVFGRKRKERKDSTAACIFLHDFLHTGNREQIA